MRGKNIARQYENKKPAPSTEARLITRLFNPQMLFRFALYHAGYIAIERRRFEL